MLAGLFGCAAFPETVLTGAGDKSEELGRVAYDAEMSGGRDTALELYRQAVAVSGGSPTAYVRLGDACLRAKMLTQATEAYRAALAKDSGNAEAQLGLGTVFMQQGAVRKALPALAKAAPLVNTGTAYNRLGVAETMAGEFSEAQATFERGLGVEPDDLDIVTNLALVTALAGESEKAATLADQIAMSRAIKPVHRRNLVIVFGIIGKSAGDARAVAPEDLSQTEFEALFRRAASIRRLTDPKARAHALGTVQGG
jgi:Flp pilus assembly protein TadD